MEDIIKEKALSWLNSPIDESAKAEIQEMMDNSDQTELAEAFYKDLEFGTGGLRGIMGVGSNRMNKYTVGMATQGLCNYLLKTFPDQEIKVAIAHDSRNKSDYFTDISASVFTANGIIVYLFPELRPTPELSFVLRHYGCKSGIVVTASHNPKEYNGYKVYWDDGAQIVAPHDKNIIEEVSAIRSVAEVKFEKDPQKIITLGPEIDNIYLERIKELSLSPEAIQSQSDLKIVFSPIHGTGITMVPEILKRLGFKNVFIVEEQAVPDGNFPTVVYPNPEEKEAMTYALNLAREKDADLIMATDPDADRVGIATKNLDGEFQLLNGNQTACLLTYYLLKKWSESGKLSGNQYIVSTIVTSELMDQIAKGFAVECYNTLTGFKHIASIMRELEGKKEFVAGGEESYGFLIGDFVRDKDAVSACALIAEMAAFSKNNGKTLFDLMIEMYEQFGFYKERLISIVKKGIKGAEEITEMMAQLRSNPPRKINDSKLVKVFDYQIGKERDFTTGEEIELSYPESNVLQFLTEDGSKISARPSGTEPKIKFYISVNEQLPNKSEFKEIENKLERRIDSIVSDLGLN